MVHALLHQTVVIPEMMIKKGAADTAYGKSLGQELGGLEIMGVKVVALSNQNRLVK